jgi:aspartyl-tRNA(Asn)/glutamyl-tRNA(Gln) amidotransferase subunit C
MRVGDTDEFFHVFGKLHAANGFEWRREAPFDVGCRETDCLRAEIETHHATAWRQDGDEFFEGKRRGVHWIKALKAFRCAAKAPDAIGVTASEGKRAIMSVDQTTVRRIARLARIAVSDEEVPHLQTELNAILDFVAELGSVDVEGVEPMTSVVPMKMVWRRDEVTDHAGADIIVGNAPTSEDHFFVVPKVIE